MASKALDLGMPEHNAMINDIGHASIDFYLIPMYLLHNIQEVVVDELNEREHVVFEQLKHSNNTVTSLKKKMKQTK